MVSAPLIAGVAKDAGKTRDLPARGFLGTGEVDFKSVVVGLFGPDEKGTETVGHKGQGVKESDKPEKAGAEGGVQVNVLATAPAVIPQVEILPPAPVEIDAVKETSAAGAHHFDELSGATGVVPLAATMTTAEAGQSETSGKATEQDAESTANVITKVASDEDAAPVAGDQWTDAGVKSFHQIGSPTWRTDDGREAASTEQMSLAVPATDRARQGVDDSVKVPPVSSRAARSDLESTQAGDQPVDIKVSEADSKSSATVLEAQAISPKMQKHAPRAIEPSATLKPSEAEEQVVATGSRQAGAEKTNTTEAQAPLRTAVHGIAPATINETKVTAVADGASVPDAESPVVLAHAVSAGAAVVKAESTDEKSIPHNRDMNSVTPPAAPAPHWEGNQTQSVVHPAANVKSRARRDDKESSPVDAISPNSQPKHVEAAATVLSSGIHKDSAAHVPRDNNSLPPTHPANDSGAMPALDDGVDDAVPSAHTLVNTAKLVQNLNQSELRLGMQSREFGSVDIRTSVARHVFSAQISVEHSDVARNLASDLPALMERLADQQVLVGNIQVHNSGLSTSSGLAQDGQAQSWKPQTTSFGTKPEVEAVHPAAIESASSGGRLDIRV